MVLETLTDTLTDNKPMSELIIAFAAPPDTATQAALGAALGQLATNPNDPLPHFRQALSTRQAQALQADAEAEFSFALPHEMAWARAFGGRGTSLEPPPEWRPGLLPLAAWEAQQRGLFAASASPSPSTSGSASASAWAWMSPCHWAVGTQQVVLQTPEQLRLSPLESQQLLEAVRPFLLEDGIRLHFVDANRWLAEGEVFRHVRTAAIERAAGRDVAQWLPAGDPGKPLRRLQSELQMLLYSDPKTEALTHAMSEARRAQGLQSVNSFWFSGAGALPATLRQSGLSAERTRSDSTLKSGSENSINPLQPGVYLGLREAALNNDLDAWAHAWLALDADLGQGLLPANAVLTLCGERAAQTWRPQSEPGASALRPSHKTSASTPLGFFGTLKQVGHAFNSCRPLEGLGSLGGLGGLGASGGRGSLGALGALFSNGQKTDALAWSNVTQHL